MSSSVLVRAGSGWGACWGSRASSAGAGAASLRAVISEGLIRMVVRAVISFSFYVFRASAFRERMSVMVLMDPG